jgi:hypothetical protein
MSERIMPNSPNIYQVKNNNNGPRGKPSLMSGPKQYGGRVATSAPLGNNLSFCMTQNNVHKSKFCQLCQAKYPVPRVDKATLKVETIDCLYQVGVWIR